MEIAKEKAELAKKETEANHSREHIEKIKRDLMHSEQEFRQRQVEIQKMGFGEKRSQ